MITSIRLVNFKNFVDETLRLGPFTMIVGTNASGKSNIRDAFRFLHGIGRGYTLPEIVGGKWGAGGQREWQPIRGAAHEVARLDSQSSTFSFHMELRGDDQPVSYSIEIEFDPRGLRYEVKDEAVRRLPPAEQKAPMDNCWQTIYETKSVDDDGHWIDVVDDGYEPLTRGKPALTQLERRQGPAVRSVSQALAGMRFWDLSPELMRHPAYPGTPLGDRGENLPAVLEKACTDPNRQAKGISARRIEFSGRRQKAARRGGGATDHRHPEEVF